MELTTITRRVGEICGVDVVRDRARPALRRARRLAGPRRRGGAGAASRRPGGRAPAPAAAPAARRRARDAGGSRRGRGRAKRRRPIDRAAYKTVRTPDELRRLDRARARGRASSPSTRETSSLDPLQAELVGVSLAVSPGEACYIPIGHRVGADDLFGGGGRAPDQIREEDAIALLKPLLEAPGVLKIGQDVKFDMQVFAQRGVTVAPIDDTDADLLRARRRRDRRRPRPGRAVGAHPRPQADRVHRGRRIRPQLHRLRARRRSTRRPNTPPRTPT